MSPLKLRTMLSWSSARDAFTAAGRVGPLENESQIALFITGSQNDVEMLTIVHGIVNAGKLCRTTSMLSRNLGRTKLPAVNTRRQVFCAAFFTSTQPILNSTHSSLPSSLRPWHQVKPFQDSSTPSPFQLAISGWTRSRAALSSSSRVLLYRGTPRGNGGSKQRTFREELSWKEWLDRIPNGYLIWGILGLNGLVFLSWQAALTNVVSSPDNS